MDAKAIKLQILKGSIARRVFFRSIILASAISIFSLLRAFSAVAPVTFTDCIAAGSESRFGNATLQSRVLSTFWSSFYCERDENLTVNVVNELIKKQLLDCGAKSLCVGEGSTMAVAAMKHMGFSSVAGVHSHRFFSLKQKKIVYELDYQDSSFDFVLSRDLDKVSVPALLVLEVERVLKPGGVGALLVGPTGSSSIPNDLIRSATPVSSLLRSSTVLHVGSVGDLNLVVFRKWVENATASGSGSGSGSAAFYQQPLPADCSSITLTKPLIQLMEPLVSEKQPPLGYQKMVPYLPKFVDVSSRKRMVYIDINGGGEILNADDGHSDWFLPYYPVDQKNFNVYFVHYNTSVMLSYVKRPGVTFVYYPGLAGKVAAKANLDDAADDDNDDDGDLEPFVGEEEFDFLAWFKETVQYADFVVLKMNAGEVEMKFLWDVFESGAICFVDELFLRCPESGNEDEKTVMGKENCMDIYKGLRNNGVYVHQWWGN
ncbi:hypothetical protein PIB30_006727 [Stylosanthes scabra]|uniref:Methyltransferase type 11 domain-containing protein n=1 Tax=Stylosanthes scabra TaxID=79078 RepID=A0ABU6S5L5_9FABA|nr:hypothetical protein [Stylosanthes scabra]